MDATSLFACAEQLGKILQETHNTIGTVNERLATSPAGPSNNAPMPSSTLEDVLRYCTMLAHECRNLAVEAASKIGGSNDPRRSTAAVEAMPMQMMARR
jgi:hypothetical protein